MINELLKYGLIFIIVFLSLILMWKLSEWIPKLISIIKTNPTLMDPNRAAENYANVTSKIAETVADKACSGSQKERKKGGMRVMLIGIALIVVSIVLSMIQK